MTAPVYDPFLELGFEATETALCDYADQILKAGYPAGTLVVPAGWQSSIGSNEPSMHLFGDFAGMVRALHDKGFRVMLTVTPFVSGDGPIFRRYRGEQMFVSRPDSTVAMAEWDGGYSAFYDLTRPEVYELIKGRLDALRSNYGIDGFLFDCGGAMPYLKYAQGGAAAYLSRWSELSDGCDFASIPSAAVPAAWFRTCITCGWTTISIGISCAGPPRTWCRPTCWAIPIR
ncbi:MAG: TIM-barrel domain-containing protein [Alistipes indistinctus]